MTLWIKRFVIYQSNFIISFYIPIDIQNIVVVDGFAHWNKIIYYQPVSLLKASLSDIGKVDTGHWTAILRVVSNPLASRIGTGAAAETAGW